MLTKDFWFFAALAFLQIPAGAPVAPTTSEPLPLIVERAEFAAADPVTGRPEGIEFTLYNVGSKAIDAWGVRMVVRLEDGYISNTGLSTDGYATPEDPERGWGPLSAGSRRTEFSSYSKPTGRDPKVVSIDVEPSFVIFADNTAAGDEQEIRSYFRQRALDHDAWPVLENVIAGVLAADGNPEQVLLDIHEALIRIKGEGVRASQAYRWLDRTLAVNLKIPQLDHSAYLQRLLSDIGMRRAKADAHYRRSR